MAARRGSELNFSTYRGAAVGAGDDCAAPPRPGAGTGDDCATGAAREVLTRPELGSTIRLDSWTAAKALAGIFLRSLIIAGYGPESQPAPPGPRENRWDQLSPTMRPCSFTAVSMTGASDPC